MEAVRPATRTPVSVLGATGYTGVELLRLLAQHPAVELAYLSSEQYRGRRASEVYPFLAGIVDEALGAPEPAAAAAGDVVFTALPHGAAAPLARAGRAAVRAGGHRRQVRHDGRRAGCQGRAALRRGERELSPVRDRCPSPRSRDRAGAARGGRGRSAAVRAAPPARQPRHSGDD